MAKSPAPKQRTGNGVAAEPETPTAESLDQVRDILFGGQMRMVDARLRSLEDRLLQEQASLRTDMNRLVNELDAAVKRDLAQHADRLATERAKRAEEFKALRAELKESFRSMERRQQKMEEAAGMADAELRDQLLKQGATLSAEVAKQGTALSAELARMSQKQSDDLDRATAALRADKLDTASLATALSDLATRLTSTARTTPKGSARG
jgi:hypothetical protein